MAAFTTNNTYSSGSSYYTSTITYGNSSASTTYTHVPNNLTWTDTSTTWFTYPINKEVTAGNTANITVTFDIGTPPLIYKTVNGEGYTKQEFEKLDSHYLNLYLSE